MAMALGWNAGLTSPARLAETRLAGLAADLAGSTRVDGEPLHRTLEELDQDFAALDPGCRRAIVERVLADWQAANPHADIALKAFACQQAPGETTRDRLVAAFEKGRWRDREENFLYWQLVRLAFLHPGAFAHDKGELRLRQIYRRRVMTWRKKVALRCRWLAPRQREERRIILVSQQFVNLLHAPTRDLLDYADVLARLGYEVEIVISPEMPHELPMAFPRPFVARHSRKLDGRRPLAYKDRDFPFWQIEGDMPHGKGLSRFLHHVAERRPLAVIDIGGNGVAADLAGQITTTLTLPLAARPAITEATFIATIGEEHVHGLGPAASQKALDLGPERFLPFRYTYRLPETWGEVPEALSRLPKEAVLGVVVGNRLDQEIADDNLRLLLSCLEKAPRLHLVFVGPFTRFADYARQHPVLGERATALGFQRDIVAIFKHCHLYLNPRRAGGGSSVAHALGCDLPVITFANGDGGFAAGAAFTVTNAQDYLQRVARWTSDEAARAEAAETARRRWATISDRKASLSAFLDRLLADGRLAHPAPLFASRKKR